MSNHINSYYTSHITSNIYFLSFLFGEMPCWLKQSPNKRMKRKAKKKGDMIMVVDFGFLRIHVVGFVEGREK